MKYIVPLLLFLDDDLMKSAQSLTNHHLCEGIDHSVQVLMCSIYYMVGIRSRTAFSHYVSKDRWERTRFEYFPQYPLKKMPRFAFYASEEAKWCRKCSNHYGIVADYLECMLEEFTFRTGKVHELAEMHGFLQQLPMEIAVRKGYRLPTLKEGSAIQLPWKNLPLKFRKKDIVSGYRAYYKSIIHGALAAFVGTKRDVPEFLVDEEPIV